jgi:hypothetical protein
VEGRAEIVAISLDDDAESPQKRINEKGCGKDFLLGWS